MAIQIEYVGIDTIKPYKNNARKHEDRDINAIKKSIKEFGFKDPIGVWKNEIVEGHGRLIAAMELGMKEVPIIRLDDLTDEQRRAYTLAHNKTAELSSWYEEILDAELMDIAEIDMSAFGFDMENLQAQNWFERSEKDYDKRQEGNTEYNEFLDKFEIAKTTDDCYTPQNIYDAVAEWVRSEYGVKEEFSRPFYPGGDYQKEDYKGKIVVDNPPFSIMSEILTWYNEHGIKYFLFAPSVSCFTSKRKSCAVCVGVSVTYENGAKVSTSFVTNMEDCVARTAPDLYKIVEEADEANQSNPMPVYDYPDNVVTAAMMSKLSKYGQFFVIKDEDASEKISELDAQKEAKKGIFGGGFLLSEKAAAEKAAAEKAAAIVWELSEREKEIIKKLGD